MPRHSLTSAYLERISRPCPHVAPCKNPKVFATKTRRSVRDTYASQSSPGSLLRENSSEMGEPAPFSVPKAIQPSDRSQSVRAHAWVGLVAAGLCGAFALRVFFIMLGPTHSYAPAFVLWRHDKGVRATVPALLILILGSLLTLARLRRAKSWAQLSRMDRALSIAGIIPAALLYYPIVITATVIGWGLWFCMVTYVRLLQRIDRHMPWGRRGAPRGSEPDGLT